MYNYKKEDALNFAKFIKAQVKEKNGKLVFYRCPYCGARPTQKEPVTFYIDLNTGKFKCNNGCEKKGTMMTLSQDFDFNTSSILSERKAGYRAFNPKERIIPTSDAITYLASKGISSEVAEKYEVTTASGSLVVPFFDDQGLIRYVKYINMDSGEETSEKNCKPVLFGMRGVKALDSKSIIICDDIFDCLSAATAGIYNVVAAPSITDLSWITHCYQFINEFEEIIVSERSSAILLDTIKARFEGKRIRYIDYAPQSDLNSLNSVLVSRGEEYLREFVKRAVAVSVDGVLQLADVKYQNIYDIPKVRTGIRDLDNLLCGGLPFGIVTVLGGKRGEGKSTLGSSLLINARAQGYPCFAYSGELPNSLFKSWMDYQVAGPNHIIENDMYGYTKTIISSTNLALINEWYRDMMFLLDSSHVTGDERVNLLSIIEKVIVQYGVKVILLDNLMTAMYMDDIGGADKYDKQGTFVRKLTHIALKYNVLIILVAHRRKNAATEDLNDEVAGSADITNLAGVVLSYDRDKDLDPSQRKLTVSKNRVFGKTNFEGFVLDYDPMSKRVYGRGDDLTVNYGWTDDYFEDAPQEIIDMFN